MNTKELLEKIARYKSAMEAETDVDTKKKFQSRIDQLEKDIAQVEATVEKKEEKIEKQEDKALEEAEKKLRRYKDAMDAETDPDTKAKFQKRIDDLEKQLKGVKEQIKEEKKEIEEQKKDIKDAVQDVQSAQKAVRTQAIKKAGKQVAARKTTATQKKTRKKTIANIISKLDKLIDKNPALKAKYKGARGGSYMQYPSVDLKRDAGRASKPFGYRFKGDNTKVPRPDQRGQSNVYYENRANRADVYPKRKIKLEDGGMMSEENTYARVLLSFGFKEIFSEKEMNEAGIPKSKRNQKGVRYFTVIHKPKGELVDYETAAAFNERYNAYLSESGVIIDADTTDRQEISRNFTSIQIIKRNSVRQLVNDLQELGLKDTMADGGMAGHGEMKKGGKVEDELYVAELRKGEWTVKDKKNPGANYTLSSKKENAENVRQRLIDSPSTLKYYRSNEYADGGMAGHGKRMSTGGVVLNIYESGADWKINKPTQREFDDYKSAKRMGEKSGAFEYEILDEITGDVMYSTHSEKMTPSLAYKDGGRQGYDDREDESLAMRRGKTASKDLKGKKKKKEKSRRDDAGFEKRAKVVYTWKPEAKQVIETMAKQPKKRGISKSILNKKPSEYYAKKFPELVNVEKQ